MQINKVVHTNQTIFKKAPINQVSNKIIKPTKNIIPPENQKSFIQKVWRKIKDYFLLTDLVDPKRKI